jgi:hypothetical protein
MWTEGMQINIDCGKIGINFHTERIIYGKEERYE